ncbi:MAG: response regulator, partial [Rhodothermales bacterium]
NGAITSEAAPLVLIVEDNPDMRTYLKSHLQARYRVIECEDGEEGLERAKACRPDLVLADVMMPKMDGYSLCRTLKSDPSLGDVPVVLLTAKTDQESRLVGLEIGADDYLEKPFSAEELLARMENLIELRRRLRDRYGEAIRLGPSQVTVSSEEASFVREVREVIEKNMEESRFGVGELAEEVGFSRRQLQRRLKAAADLSAGAYIRMMRLERAAQLLEQDAGLVSEVAYRVGFKNADHFSRLFRQVFGVPPSEYPLASQSDPA